MGHSVVLVAALVGSVLAHALTLALASFDVSTPRTPALEPQSRDDWVVESVEVGTVPDRPAGSAAPARAPSHSETPSAAEAAATSAPKFSPEGESAASREARSRRADPPRQRRPSSGDSAPRPSSATSAASAPPAESASAEPAGSLGAVGLPIGIRHFGRAFARALPAANTANPVWAALPLGRVGAIAIRVEIDAEGRVGALEFEPDPARPAALEAMVERALLLLRAGTFSVDPSAVRGGVERLTIDVTLSERPVSVREGYNPAHFHGLGSEPPTLLRPGYARFTLNSGRHFEATVRLTEP